MNDDLSRFNAQVNHLIAENRRLRVKSEADDETIRQLTDKYESLAGSYEDMVEDHRKRERELIFAADRAEMKERAITSLLEQATDLILQAHRARVGDLTPEKMPSHQIAHIEDNRLPAAPFN